MRLVAAFAALCVVAAPASAELVPRAEDGTVRYLLAEPQGLDAPVEVGRGDVAWSEQLRPAQIVRLTSTGADRNRPVYTPGLQTGEILFGYQLSSGVAYCPVRREGAGHMPRVQCYRDFDDDGDFDGGYVTISRTVQSTIMPGGLHGLIAIPAVTYEAADASEAPQASASIVFVGWRNGRARFRVRVEDETLDHIHRCEPRPDGSCEIHGLQLRITQLPQGRARIESMGANASRSLSVCFDTDAPGDPCPED